MDQKNNKLNYNFNAYRTQINLCYAFKKISISAVMKYKVKNVYRYKFLFPVGHLQKSGETKMVTIFGIYMYQKNKKRGFISRSSNIEKNWLCSFVSAEIVEPLNTHNRLLHFFYISAYREIWGYTPFKLKATHYLHEKLGFDNSEIKRN